MRAEDIMSSPVVTVRADTPAKAATALLTSHGFTALPVVDQDGHLVGVVTEADLMRNRVIPDPRTLIWQENRADTPRQPVPRTVGEVMTAPVVSTTRGADVAHIAQVMVDRHLRSVPVLDGASVVGIVSRRDLLRTLARDDLQIATDVRHQLAAYGGNGRWTVHVRDGVVNVVDDFDDADDRHVARVLAQTVPGVQAVDVSSRIDGSV